MANSGRGGTERRGGLVRFRDIRWTTGLTMHDRPDGRKIRKMVAEARHALQHGLPLVQGRLSLDGERQNRPSRAVPSHLTYDHEKIARGRRILGLVRKHGRAEAIRIYNKELQKESGQKS